MLYNSKIFFLNNAPVFLFIAVTFSNTLAGPRFLWYGNENSRSQSARVYLKNGTILAGLIKMDRIRTKKIREITVGRTSESSIYDTDKETRQMQSFNLIDLEGRKIRPFETDSVVINSLTGISLDSLWLFRVIDGKISAFNTRPSWRSKEFTHIQKEGTKIRRYSRELLAEYLKDNDYALSLFSSPLYKDGRSSVVKEYNPRKAILEYNFQTVSKSNKADSLLVLLQKEKDTERKISYGMEILTIDSSCYEAYLILGDHAAQMSNTDEAYTYYTNYLKYCDSAAKMRDVRQKIRNLQRIPMY
jgi:hypothetical protein